MPSAQSEPIFVVGYMHSGTTLLNNVIKRADGIYAPDGETKFFEFLPLVGKWFPKLSNSALDKFVELMVHVAENGLSTRELVDQPPNVASLPPKDRDEIKARLGPFPRHADVFRAAIDFVARRSGCDRWLEKTPSHVFYIDQILAVVPDARVVQIVRDPRDVIASKKTRRETVWTTERYTSAQRPRKHLEKAYDPLWDTLAWRSAVRAGMRAASRHKQNILTVRYEDLVQQPAATVARVCKFIGVEYEQKLLAVDERNSAEFATADNASGISAGSVGRWQRVLDGGEAALCELVASGTLTELGYSRTNVKFTEAAQLPGLLFASQLDLGRRLLRRWQMGGVAYLTVILRNYVARLVRLIR